MAEKPRTGDVETTFMHLRLCRDMIRADHAMRREIYGAIPCPLCRHGGTIYYEMRDGKIAGQCDSAQCVQFA
jgi:hypothetical protein